jgi:hypothetical protein
LKINLNCKKNEGDERSKKVIQLVRRSPPMLAALFVAALFAYALFMGGPNRSHAQQGMPQPMTDQENQECNYGDPTTAATTDCVPGTLSITMTATPKVECLPPPPGQVQITFVANAPNTSADVITEISTQTSDDPSSCPPIITTNVTTNAMCADFNWSVTGDFLSNKIENACGKSTYKLWTTNAGMYVATCTATATGDCLITPLSVAGCATASVVHISLGAGTIWWFNNENPGGGYILTTTAAAQGVPAGATLLWSIPSGGDKANLIGANGGPSITVSSKAPSTAVGDVTIQLSINGTPMCPTNLTVRAPDHQTHQSDRDRDIPQGNGYFSFISYNIYDQFGDILPYIVPWNEDIDGNGAHSTAAEIADAMITDYAGENWGGAAEGSDTINPANAFDRMIVDVSGLFPPCDNPQTPLDNVKVQHSPKGAWYCGSLTTAKGVKVGACTWQDYTDHGRYE